MAIATPDARPELKVATVPRQRLRECAEFTRDVFGFSDLEATPPSHLYSTLLHGAVVLGAFEGDILQGHVYAFPAYNGTNTYLYSTGLSVRPGSQNQGLGLRLMFAMRDHGRELGYTTIKWTTDALDSKNLYLYLTKCGAQLVSYHPLMYEGLYDRVRPTGIAGDDVEFVWHIDRSVANANVGNGPQDFAATETPPLLTRTEIVDDGLRGLVSWASPQDSAASNLVEVPWNGATLESWDLDAATRWRLGVRETMSALLDRGYIGTRAIIDSEARRSYVRFDRVTRPK